MTRAPLPISGIVLSALALSVIAARGSLPGSVVVGVAAIALICGLPRLPAGLAVALTVPFGWLIAVDTSTTSWIRFAVLVVASLGSVACSRADEVWAHEAVTPGLLFGSACGVFLAVPDTEEALVLVCAAALAALAGWPLRLATLGRAGAGSACAVLAWVVAIGGRGRTPSIVGGLACLGVLVWLAAVPWLRIRFGRSAAHPRLTGVRQILTLVAVQAGVVLVASRVSGVSDELGFAVVVAAVTAVAAVGGATIVGGPPGNRPSLPPTS
jgi:hypothetical protein